MDNTLRQISDEEIKNLVIDALKLFLENDAAELLKNKLNEVAFSTKIAMHIHHLMQCRRSAFPPYLHVDCEYNKLDDHGKPISSESDKNMRPDIIIHKRGSEGPNLLFCEVKKANYGVHDISKVNSALNPDFFYKYQLGLLIHNINNNSLLVRWVEPGQKAEDAKDIPIS